MKTSYLIIAFLLPLLLYSSDEYNTTKELYETGNVYVKLDARLNLFVNEAHQVIKSPFTSLENIVGLQSIELAFPQIPEMKHYFKFHFEQTMDLALAIEMIELYDNVIYAEGIPKHQFFLTPNDIASNQYNVNVTNCEQAWDLTTGNSSVVIGMVDDAVLLSHEDLAANLWTNTGEIAGNGIDDDGNGYVDDIDGWDAADNDNNPNPPNDASDEYFSHGTHCAGIAAGVTNNGLGIASVSYNVALMPIKIGEDATNELGNAMGGVEYAIANNADIISMSWGGGPESQTEQDVFTVAHETGIILIAAAGNDNVDTPMYPASYDYVINVGASDQNDNRANFSNYGATIDVMAPGVVIYSSVATSNSSYFNYDGTSMACPFVSGLAALMLSLDPTANPDRIEECLKETADNIDGNNAGFENQLGAGRVNAYEAVKCVPQEPTALFSLGTDPCAEETFTFNDESYGTDLTDWQWSFPGGNPASSTLQNPTVTYPAEGTYSVTLTVTNSLGTDTTMETITIAAPQASIVGDNVILAGYIVPITIALIGTAPFDITYTDGTNNYTINDVAGNTYEISVSPTETTTYSIVSLANDFCTGSGAGEAIIVVIQPDPNDDCDHALPFPIVVINDESCINGSFAEANAELPFINQVECLGGPQPVPALDVWYSFESVANLLEVSLTFSSDEAIVALYEGTCEGLIGRECQYGSGGSLNSTFAPVSPGVTYYLQVTSGSITDQGDFTLCIENYGENITEICMLGQTLNVTPAPDQGTYQPAQNVKFCLKVEGYNQDAAEWFHALVPEFGSGWDVSTLSGFTYPSSLCANGQDGYWNWFDGPFTGTGGNSVGPVGPGFFIETSSGGPPIDDYPGNNFGDAGSQDCFWNFCFEIETLATCPPGIDGQDLSIEFHNYADSETGSWSAPNSVCLSDPNFKFKATLLCCPIPELTGIDPSCSDPDSGSITAIPSDGEPPFTFDWSNGFSETNTSSSTIENLEEGFYYVTITDVEGCESEASYTLLGNEIDLEVEATLFTVCRGDSIQLNVTSSGTKYTWGPSVGLSDNKIPNPLAFPDETTQYIVYVENEEDCSGYATIVVEVLEAPETSISENVIICPGESTTLTASGGTSYQWSPNTGLTASTSASTLCVPTATTNYSVVITNDEGCAKTETVTVTIAPLPLMPELKDTTLCTTDQLELLMSESGYISNYDYNWSPGTGLDNPNIPGATATIDQSIDYTLEITNEFGCSVAETINIIVDAQEIEIDLGMDTILCNQSSLLIGLANDFETYIWSNSETNNEITITESGIYELEVTNSAGCVGTDEIEVIISNVDVSIAGTLVFFEGVETTLSIPNIYTSIEWNTGVTTNELTASDAGIYSVTVLDEYNCDAFDEVEVIVLDVTELYIPNAFSPNGDTYNDAFNVLTSDPIQAFDSVIYNRWGQLIYNGNQYDNGWSGILKDGDKAEVGVYVYRINVTFENGNQKEYKGNITLIR